MSKANELLTSILQWCSTPGAGHPMWDDVTKLREYIASVPAPLVVWQAIDEFMAWYETPGPYTGYQVRAKLRDLFSRAASEPCPVCEAWIAKKAMGAEPEVLVDWGTVWAEFEQAVFEQDFKRLIAYLRDRHPTLASLPTKPVEPPAPALPEEGPPKIERWRFVATGHEFYGIETQNGIVCEFRGQLFVRNHSINELDKLDPEPKEETNE